MQFNEIALHPICLFKMELEIKVKILFETREINKCLLRRFI